jgi:hypothetical protein
VGCAAGSGVNAERIAARLCRVAPSWAAFPPEACAARAAAKSAPLAVGRMGAGCCCILAFDQIWGMGKAVPGHLSFTWPQNMAVPVAAPRKFDFVLLTDVHQVDNAILTQSLALEPASPGRQLIMELYNSTACTPNRRLLMGHAGSSWNTAQSARWSEG